MHRRNRQFYLVLIFVLAQIAWFFLLGLWIYWYVSNYLIFSAVDKKLSGEIASGNSNVFALVSGLVLLVLISVGMSLIFIYLTRQFNLARHYDNFIASVTHELKSPLSSIQLYLETLRSRKVAREKQQAFISMMLQDVNRLNNLINSILKLSVFDYGRSIRRVKHDYQVYSADDLFRGLIEEAVLQFKLQPEAVTVKGAHSQKCVADRSWLKIVIDNLFDNAIKYSVNPVHIHINLESTPDEIVFLFSDEGIGIESRDQQKIFNKFQRVDRPDSPSVKGTGLGLYWVKQIIRDHGGKVSVFSAGRNRGTTFRIGFPVYPVSKKRYINNLLKLSKTKQTQTDSYEE
jgi:signal transduction histidine kinase